MALKTRGFAHRIDIAATPEKVWAALTDPVLLCLWLGPDARIRAQQGGSLTATVAPGFSREALIDIIEPPRRLRLIYLPTPPLPMFDGAVVEDILLDPQDGETIVRLLCSGVPDSTEWNAHYMKLRTSVERALARLKVLVEQRERMIGAARKET
jgi:uncharacterized protein YndB with AHSA1/START domain